MSTVISLENFRKNAEKLKKPKVTNPIDGFTPEAKADDLTNLLVAGLYKGLSNCDIDPLALETHELLAGVYELVSSITARKFGVFNELNATRDIQAKGGEPFYLIGVATMDKEKERG